MEARQGGIEVKERFIVLLLAIALSIAGFGQEPMATAKRDVYGSSSCMGCHGMSGMGGLGPPLAQMKIADENFQTIVRKGRGMMPAVDSSVLSDEDLREVQRQIQELPWDEKQIPIAFRVGSFLSTKNVSRIFMVAGILSLLLSIKVLWYWVKLARLRELTPTLKKFGWFRAAGIFVRSLVIDGFCVASLWRKDKFRWAMHGLMLYGFLGLALADILMQVNDPSRAKLPLDHPLKILAVLCGASVITGLIYVLYRYKTDKFIDNGVTLGRDFLFVNLLLHSIFSGFLTVALSRSGAFTWVMPIYIYHLVTVCALIVSMPFTRMNHIFIVPVMAGITAVTDAVVKSQVDIGFVREPSPGRHHKSMAIATSVLENVDPERTEDFRLRYFP